MVCHRVTSKSKVRTQNVKCTIRGEFCVSIACRRRRRRRRRLLLGVQRQKVPLLSLLTIFKHEHRCTSIHPHISAYNTVPPEQNTPCGGQCTWQPPGPSRLPSARRPPLLPSAPYCRGPTLAKKPTAARPESGARLGWACSPWTGPRRRGRGPAGAQRLVLAVREADPRGPRLAHTL